MFRERRASGEGCCRVIALMKNWKEINCCNKNKKAKTAKQIWQETSAPEAEALYG